MIVPRSQSLELASAQAALAQDTEALRAIDDAYAQVIVRAQEQRRQIRLLLRLVGPHAAPSPPTTAEALRLRRVRLRLSQAAVARAACLSRGEISDLERARRRHPETAAHVGRVLSALEYRAQGRTA